MRSKNIIKYVNEGGYAAEVEVTLIETDSEWSPYYSLDDAAKLDRVLIALQKGDLKAAAREAKIFRLQPIAAE